ncbi:MAG: glycosyltransferase [Myxococcales bacterium]
MKLVVFGLTISSSWGNGHATLWRGLAAALSRSGHRLDFYERDAPYYAAHRDCAEPPGARLHLYTEWKEAAREAARELRDADAAMVTSYCPDGPAATALAAESRARVKLFYDMDTPVTVERALSGSAVDYIGPDGLRDFDVVLSFTGGRALPALRDLFGARRTATLYGSVDPLVHRPAQPMERFAADFSYLGTYARNRQRALEQLFLEPARRLPRRRFIIAGAQYPQDFPWAPNIAFVQHVPPAQHPAFYCSSPLTLNVTRAPMATMGYCPSGRLFEAAACGVPVLTDAWEGVDAFFRPGEEILVAQTADDVLAALSCSRQELARIGYAARQRALEEHTAEHRARELISIIEEA